MAPIPPVFAPFIVGIVSLLVGALGIYVGTRFVLGRGGYVQALITGLVGAIVWLLASAFLSFIPLVGSFLPLIAWMWVVKARYDTSWLNAALIGLTAWVTVIVVLAVLGFFGFMSLSSIGVPGV